jgi:hypothetical protein
LGGNGGGFFHVRADDPGALAAAREELQAPLREMAGEEEFGRIQGSRDLRDHPRPLADVERSALQEAASPLLLPARFSRNIREDSRRPGTEAACAWIQGPGRTGEGLCIRLDSSPARRVEQLAE